ncbi:MAG: MBL fold metallo-hydrolase [Candidatus Zixiibacteriota bacterium]
MATQVHTLVVGPFAANCYLLWERDTAEGLIIDPGAEADEIAQAVDEFQIAPKAILLTHGHGDHIAAVAELKQLYNVPMYIGRGEEELLADPSANISAFFDHPIVAPKPDSSVRDEQLIRVAGIELLVLATPGHTPAGVCYLEEEAGRLFSGDTLFAGSIGRTDLAGGDYEQLIRSIETKIMPLPDNVTVYPGHGPQTTVGTERVSNPFLIKGRYA